MKKYLLLFLLLFALVAGFTKPDDKTCIIEGVKAVWGKMVPDVNASPEFFNEFMDLTSASVTVKDWLFFKQVVYTAKDEKRTVAFGAFKNVFATVKSVETKNYVPPVPVATMKKQK